MFQPVVQDVEYDDPEITGDPDLLPTHQTAQAR